LEVIDDLLNDFAKFLVDPNRIVAVDAGDEIGTSADIHSAAAGRVGRGARLGAFATDTAPLQRICCLLEFDGV